MSNLKLSKEKQRQLDEAGELFRRFTGGGEPGKVEFVTIPDPPPVAVVLGTLVSVSYVLPGDSRTEYVHKFANPAQLLASPDGKALFIVGNKIRVNGRGITG